MAERRERRDSRAGASASELQEKVVYINRVSKVVKGGRRFSLTALVVVGDGAGNVGVGIGKSAEVPLAIKKGVEDAKKNMFKVPLSGTTIPHPIIGEFGAGKVMLKPAAPGTGVIAGGPIRALLDLAGIHDVLSKSLGSDNALNMVRAAAEGLKNLASPEDIARRRGLSVRRVYTGQE